MSMSTLVFNSINNASNIIYELIDHGHTVLCCDYLYVSIIKKKL